MTFIPREKLGKKARRELDNQLRLSWGQVHPATKTFKSKKHYKRDKSHDYRKDDWNSWDFFYQRFRRNFVGNLTMMGNITTYN